jgi:hypothetical protein
MQRDGQYEHKFLTEAVEAAARRFGIDDPAYVSQVLARLEQGQRDFGDSWVQKNLPAEGREEGLDGGAYAVLEGQKQLALQAPDMDQVAFHVFEAATHAVAMSWHFQQAATAQA